MKQMPTTTSFRQQALRAGAALLLILLAAPAAPAQPYTLRASIVSPGGSHSTGAGYTLYSTFGQAVAGPEGNLAGNNDYQLGQGFWYHATGNAGPLAVPTALDDAVATDEDTPVMLDVLANDTDPAGDPLSILAVGAAMHGTITLSGDTVLTYTPEADFFGDDIFSYTVANALGGTASATVSVTINPVNDAPRFTTTPTTDVPAGTTYRYRVETTDVEDDAVTLSAPRLPDWLAFEDHGDGTATLSGTPTNADVGEHAVTLAASDGALVQEQAFTITVGEVGVAAPQLVAPEDGAVVTTPTVRLRWEALPGATAYDVQVDTESDFSSPAEAQGVHDTEVEVTGLPLDATVFWRVRAVEAAGPGPFSAAFRFTTATNVATEDEDAVPTAYALHPNYPNPFNPTTTIAYELPQAGAVRLVVYDLFGREVARLVDGARPAGRHEVVFEAGTLASGAYFYRIEAGTWSQVRQFVLLK